MQCVNCQFYNMPGLTVCGRCGSSLVVPDTIDVIPPRASARSRSVRRWLVYPFGRSWFGMKDRARHGLTTFRRGLTRELDIDLPDRHILLCTIIPGWAQSVAGYPKRGKLFLWLYVSLVLGGLLFFGSTLGSVLLGLAVSVHVSSVIDLLGGRGDVLQRIVVAAGTMAIVFLLLYLPLGALMNQVAMTRQLNQDMGPFRRGDVVLVNRWDRPEPGQMVLFWMGREIRASGGHHVNYQIPVGERVARVIAGPGQRVEWDGTELKVDGRAVNLAKTGIESRGLPNQNPFTPPAGHYLVQPVGVPDLDARVNPDVWRASSLAREEDIRGRIYMLYHPLRRRVWLP